MHDITDPLPYLPGPNYGLWIGIAVLTLLLLAALITLLLKNKKVTPSSPPITLDPYLERLKILKEQSAQNPLSHIATQASLILREYLQDKNSDPALFETHEELQARQDSFKHLPLQAKQKLTQLLTQLTQAKYAPTQNTTPQPDQASNLIEQTTTTLKALHSTNTTLEDHLP